MTGVQTCALPISDFSDRGDIEKLLRHWEHALVVPEDTGVVYRSFFAGGHESLACAQDNWSVHPFAASVASVLGRRSQTRCAPLQYRGGRFVLDAEFYHALAGALPRVLCEYLVRKRRELWDTYNVVRVVATGERLVYSTRSWGYTSVLTGAPRAVTSAVVLDPPDVNGRPLDAAALDFLLGVFSKALEEPGDMLKEVPVLPACMTHALHLETFPGLPPPRNDNYARARLAYLVHAIARATGLPPLEAVDHSHFLASLNPHQIAHYMERLKAGDRNKMSGPLCRNTSRDVRENGLTCPKCPRACGRPNKVPVAALVGRSVRPINTMGLD